MIFGWNQYKKYVIQEDLFSEISHVAEKTVLSIDLRVGDSPYTPEKCLTLKDQQKIQNIVQALEGVSRETAPLPLTPQIKFQLVFNYPNGLQTDLLGTIYEKYPDDVYLERNLWEKTGNNSYSYQPQNDLYWPDRGPWARDNLKDALLSNCAKTSVLF